MARHFVIDLSDDFVRVLEVRREFTADEDPAKRIAYFVRSPSAEALVVSFDPDPKFYGQLDKLLVTKSRIANAAPIIPEKPVEAEP